MLTSEGKEFIKEFIIEYRLTVVLAVVFVLLAWAYSALPDTEVDNTNQIIYNIVIDIIK